MPFCYAISGICLITFGALAQYLTVVLANVTEWPFLTDIVCSDCLRLIFACDLL